MSTKIYHGKRLPDMSVYQLNEFYKSLRSELIPAAKREYYKFVVKVAQEIYVYIQTGKYPGRYHIDLTDIDSKIESLKDNATAILDYAQQFANATVRQTSAATFITESEDDADYDTSIVVIPIKDKTLCLPYANNDALHKILFNREELVDYGYWNNVDQPEDVSDDEWNQRKADWDEALPGCGVPKNNGMVLRIVDSVSDVIEHHYLDIKHNFMDYLLDDDELLQKVANGVVLERQFAVLEAEYANDTSRDKITIAMRCLRLSTDYVKEHPEEVEEEKKVYANKFNSIEFFKAGLYEYVKMRRNFLRIFFIKSIVVCPCVCFKIYYII